jgi:hypothetical protein
MRYAFGLFSTLFACKSYLRDRNILYIPLAISLASLAVPHVLHLSCKWRNINIKVSRSSHKEMLLLLDLHQT